MKKVLFLMMAILGFIACSDDDKVPSDNFPISGLELPTAENGVFKANSELVIKGEGFTEESEIWFKQADVTRNLEGSLKAKVVSVNNENIVITTPEVYGNQELLLHQNGQVYVLGKLEFTQKVNYKAINQLKGTFSKNTDIYTFDFTYTENNRIDKIVVSYPFFKDIRVLNFQFYYAENNQIVRITSQIAGKTTFMSDAKVSYPSESTVMVDNIDVKKYTYTLNELGKIIMVGDSRNDKVDKFTYDENGNMIIYAEIDYGHKPVDYNCIYNDMGAVFIATDLPDWAWHFMMTDLMLTGNSFLYSLHSPNTVIGVMEDIFSYEYNEQNQPIKIKKNGVDYADVIYRN